jgi:hypothetical protein
MVSFFLVAESCKKESSVIQPSDDYRLVSKVMFRPDYGPGESETFEYQGNRISRHTMVYSPVAYDISEFTYDGNIVSETKSGYKNEELTFSTITEYHFQNDQITLMKRQSFKDTLVEDSDVVEFDYHNGLVSAYSEYHDGVHLFQGEYTYNDNLLVRYEVELYNKWTEHWVLYNRTSLEYDHGILVKQEIEPAPKLKKYLYYYEDGRLKRKEQYEQVSLDWRLNHVYDFHYDEFGNLVSEELLTGDYEELIYRYEYTYEKGQHNLKHILYHAWTFPGMPYPRP